MAQRMNLYSFIASFVCLGLFFLFSFTEMLNSVENSLKVHPLSIILALTIISFFLGVIGLSGMKESKTGVRSFTTLVLTSGLSILLIFIIGVGKLLG
ncbi:hypothetical protein [Sutcliffiella deserti]|uniref:hypothetical protein n=1 Tax=Sutcliffiella deserti TaxID=2875501 RepID=UPI001CBAD8B2|nr:hypothetical protein [Sutcliffiella deserti]